MLEEAIGKANLCDDQNKNKRECVQNWNTKRRDRFDPINKNNKLHKNIGNNYKEYQGSNYKSFKPKNPATKEREPPTAFNKNIA